MNVKKSANLRSWKNNLTTTMRQLHNMNLYTSSIVYDSIYSEIFN